MSMILSLHLYTYSSYLHFLPEEQTESLAKMFLINPGNKTRAGKQARKPGR